MLFLMPVVSVTKLKWQGRALSFPLAADAHTTAVKKRDLLQDFSVVLMGQVNCKGCFLGGASPYSSEL